MAQVLKEKTEYKGKSYSAADSVTTNVNVTDRLDKLKDASDNWKNRVETKDAVKFTVAAKTTNLPVELPFKKSQVRTCIPMVDFESADPSPLGGLAKSTSMIVSSSALATNGNKSLILPMSGAFLRSVSVPGQEENGSENTGVRVTVPKLDEDKLFDKFFTKSRVADDHTKSDLITEGDLDAITMSTQR